MQTHMLWMNVSFLKMSVHSLTSSAGIAAVIFAIAFTGLTTSTLSQWLTIVTTSTPMGEEG